MGLLNVGERADFLAVFDLGVGNAAHNDLSMVANFGIFEDGVWANQGFFANHGVTHDVASWSNRGVLADFNGWGNISVVWVLN